MRLSACTRWSPGESWTGRGTDLLFADCTPEHPYGGPSFNLEEGRREVTVTAWWPGAPSISATTHVDLFCTAASR